MDDLIGKRFGRLTILKFSHKTNWKKYYLCQCDCGNKKAIYDYSLKKGETKSCGCLYKESRGGIINHFLYKRWIGIKARCYNENFKEFDRYGGRGIFMCEEWKNNARAFIDWSMKNGYKKGLELDRINNDDGYYPENCRWVKHQENSRNMGRCHIVEYNGEKRHWLEWCEVLGISPKSIEHLVERYNLTYAEAFDRKLYYKYNPHTWSWERITGA